MQVVDVLAALLCGRCRGMTYVAGPNKDYADEIAGKTPDMTIY